MKLKPWTLAGLLLAAAGCGTNTDNSTVVDNVTGDDAGASGGGGNGATAGNGSAGASGGGASSGSNDGNCKEYVVRNEQVTPDMLVVLDRSGSMKTPNVNRWDPSVAGLKEITGQLDAAINFGLMTFPSDASCGAGTIQVPIGAKKAAAVATALDMTMPGGGTPTAPSLKAAHTQLGNSVVGPDQVFHPKLVLLVTDGAPNCGNNCMMPTDPTDLAAAFQYAACVLQASSMQDPAAVDQSVAEITSMAGDGIKTYVIGYDTKKDAALASAMDMMAAAGGTGDTTHRAVEDTASLVTAFKDIASKAVSCTFVLEEAAKDPSYVLVKVDGQQLNLNQPDGWTLGGDGKTVEVKGASCALLQSGGGQHSLSVQIKCDVVPII